MGVDSSPKKLKTLEPNISQNYKGCAVETDHGEKTSIQICALAEVRPGGQFPSGCILKWLFLFNSCTSIRHRYVPSAPPPKLKHNVMVGKQWISWVCGLVVRQNDRWLKLFHTIFHYQLCVSSVCVCVCVCLPLMSGCRPTNSDMWNLSWFH